MSESSSEAAGTIEVSEDDMAAAAAAAAAEETAEGAEDTAGDTRSLAGKTAWVRRMETPLRSFLRTETGSASVLAAATVLALIWANMSISSYQRFWSTRLSVLVGSWNVTLDLHEFVNSGLMALFFLVVGLEARREFDVGELRIRSRVTLPVIVGLGGMAVPVIIFLIANAGRPGHARLGHVDVDRHRLRARRAGPGRPQAARPGPHLPAHLLGGRRPGRPGGHRGRVQLGHQGDPARLRARVHRRRAWCCGRAASGTGRCTS